MSLFRALFGVVRSVAQVVVRVVTETASAFVDSVSGRYREVADKYNAADVARMKRDRLQQVERVNDEIHYLTSKKARDGRLNEQDQSELNRLLDLRRNLRGKIDNAREFEQAKDVTEHGHDYKSRIIDPSNPNDLTRIGGQAMLGKPCQSCQRPMSLRWATKIQNPAVDDLFWGCTGFFVRDEHDRAACTFTEPLTPQDQQIFAVMRPGMELPQDRLNRIVEAPTSKNLIVRKLNNHLEQSGENYLCPVHHEPMRLREKRNADSLLDTYYMQCPRCSQTVKIKSATQLDEIMNQLGEGALFES